MNLEQFRHPLQLDSFPFWQFVELDRSHFEDLLELFAAQMTLQKCGETLGWL